MVWVRIILVIMLPVVALVILAFTQVDVRKHISRGDGRKSKEDLGEKQTMLIDYLQSSRYGDVHQAEIDHEMEREEEHDSG